MAITYTGNLKKLTASLEDGERVVASCGGLTDRATKNQAALLAVTNTRIVFYASRLFGFDMETIEASKISSVGTSKLPTGPVIRIAMSGGDLELKWVNKGDVKATVDAIRERIGNAREGGSSKSPAESLADLAKLRDAGAISAEDFEAKKAELLARM